MKPTEYPEQDARTTPSTPVAPAVAGEVRPETEKPRYLHLPVSAEESRAQRNLALAVICCVLSVIGLWLGFKFDRSSTLQCLAASLGTFGLLWMLYNFQIFRQKHGQFLGLGLVVLLGATLPFVAAGLGKLDRLADERMNGQTADNGSRSTPPPVPTVANAPAAPTAPELSPEDLQPTPGLIPPRGASSKNGGKETAAKNEPADDGIVRDFVSPPPDPKDGKIISVKEDCIVKIDGRKWRLKAGQTYKFKSVEDGVVTFIAGDQEVSIESEFVKFVGQSLETPEKIRQMAIAEAATRYPALRDADSPENRLFLRSRAEMEGDPGSDTFFNNPRWPVILADQLASAHGWKRAGVAEAEEGADPAAATPAPASETEVPPAAEEPSKEPQAAPPSPGKAVAPTSAKGEPGLPSIPKTPLPEPGVPSIPKTELAEPPVPSIPKTELAEPPSIPAEKVSTPAEKAPAPAAEKPEAEKPAAAAVPPPAEAKETPAEPAPAIAEKKPETEAATPASPPAAAPAPAATKSAKPAKKVPSEKSATSAIVPQRVR